MARRTVEEMLAAARSRLERIGPEEAAAAVEDGAVLVDIRSNDLRTRDGHVPVAIYHHRNVLEWRADPASPDADPRLADLDARVIVMCDEGYTSSLAAVALQELGFTRVTDLEGGFQAWRAAGLPVDPA